MTYAIISDIHGNHPALAAAIKDAQENGADEYILIGDYTSRIPWDNEVVDTIKSLSPAHIIRGNGEGHYLNMQKLETLTPQEQFKPIYWAYNKISPDNLAYLLALPETMTVSHNGIDIYLAHSIDFFFTTGVIDFFHTRNFSNMMLKNPISHQEYLAQGKEAVLTHAHDNILALPKGVHLFGHNHLQFYMEHEGRLFINPGSCGMAADWDATAAYTLLTLDTGQWVVQERRVKYDLEATAEGFITTGFHEYTPVWSKVIQKQILTGKECMDWFVIHINETKMRIGQAATPDEVWDAAVNTWEF